MLHENNKYIQQELLEKYNAVQRLQLRKDMLSRSINANIAVHAYVCKGYLIINQRIFPQMICI